MSTCLYMKDFVQPGKVHLNAPESSVPATLLGERCFFEMCPVNAASVAKEAVQLDQEHFVVPLGACTALRCLRRSEREAKVALQVVPQGMSHWQTRAEEGLSEFGEFAVVDCCVVAGTDQLSGCCNVSKLGSGC